MTRERDRERENPLPPDAWVELVGQFDESDDARGRYLAARRRPYDAVEQEIAPVRPAFPSSPSEPFTAYLDDVLRLSQLAEGGRLPAPVMGPRRPPAGPGMTLVEACRRLAAEEPALFACVSLCRIKGRSERAAAAELGIANGLVNRRKWAGVAQLVVWSHRPEGEVEAWLAGLRRLWGAREATAVAEDRAATVRRGPMSERGEATREDLHPLIDT